MDMLQRFYDVMVYFLDDNRVAAHAIVKFSITDDNEEKIYHDLLAVKINHWTPVLERVVQEQKNLEEWSNNKIFELDMMNSNIWSIGDVIAIQRGVWKYETDD